MEKNNLISFVPDIGNIDDLEWYMGDVFSDLNYVYHSYSHICSDILKLLRQNENIFHITRETLVMTTSNETSIFSSLYNRYDIEGGVYFNLRLKLIDIDTLYCFLRRVNDCFIFVRMKINDKLYYVHIHTKFVFTLSITYLHSIFITEYIDIYFDLWRAYSKLIREKLVTFDHHPLNLQHVCTISILKHNLSYDKLPKIISKGIGLKSVINDWQKIIKGLDNFVERQKLIEHEIWKHDLRIFEIKQCQKKSLAYLQQQALIHSGLL